MAIGRSNGSGTVYKLSGKRKRPFRAVITTGWEIVPDKDGKPKTRQIRTTIGYFSTRDEATAALIQHNSNPYSMNLSTTFSELYYRWYESEEPRMSESSKTTYQAAYSKCASLWNKPFAELTLDDLQYVIDNNAENGCAFPTIKPIRGLFRKLYAFALPRDLAKRDLADFVDVSKYYDSYTPTEKRNFTDSEISMFWDLSEESDGAKIALMLIYSGMRIGEFLNLKKSDVSISERFASVTRSKTKAGIRKVPLAKKTLDFWRHFADKENTTDYFITIDNRDFSGTAQERGYRRFRDSVWNPLLESLGMPERRPHETRHTTATLLHRKEIHQPKVNAILGHSGTSLSERTYTHLSIKDLLPEIDKI